MFSRFFEFIRGVIRKMFGKKELSDVFNIDVAVSDVMRDAIDLWDKLYRNEAPWLKEPTASDPTRVVSLGIPAFIASEKARMATLEMKSAITDGTTPVSTIDDLNTRAGYMNSHYRKLLTKIRKELEYGIALGGLVIKPYLFSLKDKQLEFSYTTANNFFPIRFDSTGKLTCAAFLDSFVDGNIEYTKVEIHTLDLANKQVSVVNKVYKNEKSNYDNDAQKNLLGVEIALSEVPIWSEIPPETVINNVDRLLFSYFKMPEANTFDYTSPLGVSAYSRATSLIKDADMQYSRLLWEFEGGELAVDVDRGALATTEVNGKLIEMPTMLQRRLYRKVDLGDESTYEVFNPNLRDVNLINGLNTIFMRIEDVCGISRGVLSDITRSEAKTATEMLILKQRSFAANSDIQMALQNALDDVVYVMNVYCDLYNLAPAGEYYVSYEWDDSLISSPSEELNRRIQLTNLGIESKLSLRMWYFGETEEQARIALQNVNDEKDADAERTMKYSTSNNNGGE